MSEKTASTLRRLTAAVTSATVVIVGAVAVTPAVSAAEPDVTLTPNPAYSGGPFKGWGTSLVWMANATGNYPAALKDQLIDMVFGDDGLNLNIARYNVGGGNATDVPSYLRPGGAVPGWWNPNAALTDAQGAISSNYADRDRYRAAWTGQNATDYNFAADSAQLAWVDAIKDEVDTWEAFSNSPPYFMTNSGFVSGGFNANDDQIRTDSVDEFAQYLKTVVEHVENTHGIEFDSIDPLNEPNTNYWGTTLGSNGWPTSASRQEGAHAGPGLQSQVIKALDAELAEPGTTTGAIISAPDETSPAGFVTDWNGWDTQTRQIVDQLNVHTYSTNGRQLARDIAKANDKPLWMSEVEGNWGGDSWNPNSMENGLGLASLITNDLRDLESDAWVLWQPVEDLYNMEKTEKKNWGSIFIDLDCNAEGNSVRRLADGSANPACGIQINSKYNALRNFTHYIEPGDQIVPVDNTDTTAAINADGVGASLVYTNNGSAARVVEIDLSNFGDIAEGATVTPIVTTASPDGNRTQNALVQGSAVSIDRVAKTATLTVPAKSVTTFEVGGVSGVAAEAPMLRDSTSFVITGQASGKPLEGGTSAARLGQPGSSAQETTQTWAATRVVDEPGTSRDRFVLRLADGRALASSGTSATAFKTVTDAEAASDPTVQWMVNSSDGKTFILLNAATARVLDVSGASTSVGASVGLWDANWAANQSWTLDPVGAHYPQPDLATLAGNDFVLYFANAGAANTSAVAPGDRLGLYQTRSDQPFGVDAKTGARWGYLYSSTSNPAAANTSTSLVATDTARYDAEPSGANLSNREIAYAFDLPNGTYDVTFGVKLFSGWGDRTVELRTEGTVRESVNTTASALVEKTYEVNVTDGRLDASVHSRAGRTTGSTDPTVNYIVVKAQNSWTTDVLEALLESTDVNPDDYTLLSQPAWLAARETAQELVDDESTDAAAIEAAYNELTDAFGALVHKIAPYDRFNPGDAWLDTGGNVLQAHGGQVVPSKDDDGRTIYYLYGEDRTNGYHGAPGVHVYSSYDLYNWEDRGVALRALASASQFEEPYFEALYGGYTQAQKDAVYRDLGTTPVAGVTPPIIERPKVIYNESTGKWVMWAHMDGPSETSTAQYAKAKAGVAISDSPFGPFKYIDSYYLNYSPEGWDTPGMARDMNLFVDDDGTGYIIYSSEGNGTMYISKLDEEYTDLATPADQAVEGVDFNRIFVGWSREAPAMFKHDERYFLLTSGTSGWAPNPTRYASATDIMGAWSEIGDPFPWWAQTNSWDTQPTSVIPFDPENGKYIFMGDRWNGGTDLKNAQLIWLPLNMGEGGDTLAVEVWDEWTLDDLDQWAVWDVTGVPASLPVGESLTTPTVTVTQNGASTSQTVQWSVSGSTATPGVITATGTLPGFGGRTFTRSIPVVPAGVRYAVNAGDEATADWSALMATAQAEGPVLNSGPDQPYGADAGTEKSWGYLSEGSQVSGTGDMFSTLRYAVSGRDLTYRFSDLQPGTYTVYAGYADPWAQYDDRGARVTVNGVVREADHDYSSSNQTATYANVTVGQDGELTFSLKPTRGPDVQLSWLIVSDPNPDTAAPTVTAATNPASAPGANGWFTGAASLVASATDATGVASIEYRVGVDAWAAYTGPVASPVGVTTYQVRATDTRGNVSAAQSIVIRRDAVAPTTSYSAVSGPTSTTVTLAATDATSGVSSIQYRVDGGGWQTYSAPFAVTGAGSHTVAFQATDAAGNVETEQTRTVLISSGIQLEPVVSTRCVGSKAYVYVTVRNAGGAPVDIAVATPFGGKSFASVQPGKVASFSVNSRAGAIPADSVTVTGAPAGGPVAVTTPVAYPAILCH